MELTSGYESLEALMVDELKTLFDAEKQHLKVLSKLEKGAETEELKAAFQGYSEEAKNQVSRFENIFKILKLEAKSITCKPMRALIREEKEILKNRDNSLLKDAALIGAARKAAYYEIAFYQTVISQAKQLRLDKVVEQLEESHTGINNFYTLLTKIADGSIFKMGITSLIATMADPIKT